MLSLFLFFWQQKVNYQINVELDTLNYSLQAVEYITYYNHSPDTLDILYLHLYANAFRNKHTTYAEEAKRMGMGMLLRARDEELGHIDIRSLIVDGQAGEYKIEETLMSVYLNQPLSPGDSTVLRIEFFLKIPHQFSRLGHHKKHYEIVQWYPKPCVYDEKGWHLDTYHALGEFYGEFGNFDVSITLPADFVVAGTGIRTEPEDIKFIDTLITTRRKILKSGEKTVRFYACNVHDFAWVADPDYLVEKYMVDSIDIYIFYLKKDAKKWRNAGNYAIDAVSRYNSWYGRYPYKSLSVVDGTMRGGMEYPNLVIIGVDEDRFTRSFEGVIIHEIGHQWFYGVLGSNEMDEAWLDEGFTTYTEIRYFEDKYGRDNSLFKLKFLPRLSRRYMHRMIYYITQTNFIELPVLTPAYKFVDVPIAYQNAAYSKPALFLINLEGILGQEIFTNILRNYFETYKFKHPTTSDFIRICEQVSGRNLAELFEQFLNTDDVCDWTIKQVKANEVVIENRGQLSIPVDVFIKTDKGGKVFSIPGGVNSKTISLAPEFRIRQVIIDPHHYTLESNSWNNYYPRKIKFKPFFALPSFDAYQIIYIPYLWYSNEDGFTPGVYLFGGQFVDLDFIKGRHQWTAGLIYGIKSRKIYTGFSYQTPIIFKRGRRIRFLLRGSNSNDEDKFRIGFHTNLGIPLTPSSAISLENTIAYYRLKSFLAVDSIDWELGKNIVLENILGYKRRGWDIRIALKGATQYWGGDWSYLKASCEIKRRFFPPINLGVRIFGGKIFGIPPKQEMFYLCGRLRISLLADLFFNQRGYFSPQEHLHTNGDGNMVGYQGDHIRSTEMFCVNLELPARLPLRIFGDFGYYGETVLDFGMRLVLGPIEFNLPLYATGYKPWRLNWSLGL